MDDELKEKLPPGVALSWGLVKQSQRGPKREMSIKQIVDTAVSIADKEGLSAVSMSRVAASLGFTTMSLYRYVPGKDDLLLLMQEAVCDIPIPAENKVSHWRESMREFVRISISVFRDHPWFGDIPISGVPITPSNLRMVNWALQFMSNLPLNDYEKMSIVLLLSSYARASGMLLRDLDRAMQAGASPGAFSGLDYSNALKQLVTPERFPYLHPVVISGAYTGENEDENTVGDDFGFGLERILDGIEYYLTSKKVSR
jgi:AcrR family transcriptional regulator